MKIWESAEESTTLLLKLEKKRSAGCCCVNVAEIIKQCVKTILAPLFKTKSAKILCAKILCAKIINISVKVADIKRDYISPLIYLHRESAHVLSINIGKSEDFVVIFFCNQMMKIKTLAVMCLLAIVGNSHLLD